MVLTGTYELSGKQYTMRLDMTTKTKVWHCLRNVSLFDTRKYNFHLEDIVFAIVDVTNENARVYGDDGLASLFMAHMMKSASLANQETAHTSIDSLGSKMRNSDGLLNVEFVRNAKGHPISISAIESDAFAILMTEVTSKAKTSISALLFGDNDLIATDVLVSSMKGASHAMGFPTQLEMCITYDMTWIWREDGTMRKHYRIVTTLEELRDICENEIKYAKVLASDFETDGLNICSMLPNNPNKSRVVGLSLSWKLNQAIYITFDHTEVPNVDIDAAMDLLRPYLEKVPGIGANIIFDAKCFYELGINVNYKEDVLLMWYNLDPAQAKFIPDLKGIIQKLLGIKQPSLGEISKGGEAFVKYFPKHLMYCYCCADADNTLQVWDALRKLYKDPAFPIRKQQLYGYYQDIRVAMELYKDEYQGVDLDIGFMNDAIHYAEQDMRICEEIMYKFAGQYLYAKTQRIQMKAKGASDIEIAAALTQLAATPEYQNARYVFQPSNDNEIRTLFFDIFGIKPLGYTAAGLKSVSATTRNFLLKEERKPSELENSTEWLRVSLPRAIDRELGSTGDPLISKKEFNTKKHPIVYLYSVWKLAYAELTKFYYPLREMAKGNGATVYMGFRIKNTETYRMTHRLQTLKGIL